MNLMDQLTDKSLVTSLASKLCPACGGKKQRAQTFCRNDYFKLPHPARRALYAGLGHGYREAVHEAMGILKAQQFHVPTE